MAHEEPLRRDTVYGRPEFVVRLPYIGGKKNPVFVADLNIGLNLITHATVGVRLGCSVGFALFGSKFVSLGPVERPSEKPHRLHMAQYVDYRDQLTQYVLRQSGRLVLGLL